jgi:hypothetical protein
MSKRTNYYNKVVSALQELHTLYPNYNMGRHIATALDGYGDTWGLTDKELLYALTKYKGELEMDVPHTDDVDIDQIIKEGMDLDSLFKDEDNGDY